MSPGVHRRFMGLLSEVLSLCLFSAFSGCLSLSFSGLWPKSWSSSSSTLLNAFVFGEPLGPTVEEQRMNKSNRVALHSWDLKSSNWRGSPPPSQIQLLLAPLWSQPSPQECCLVGGGERDELWKNGKKRGIKGWYICSLSFRSTPILFFKPELEGFSQSSLCDMVLTSALSRLADIGGRNHRFVARLMVHQILVFYPSVPVAVNFSETLLGDLHLVLWLYQVWEMEGACFLHLLCYCIRSWLLRFSPRKIRVTSFHILLDCCCCC